MDKKINLQPVLSKRYQKDFLKNQIKHSLLLLAFSFSILGIILYIVKNIPYWDLGLVILCIGGFLLWKLSYFLEKKMKEKKKLINQSYREQGLEEMYIINGD